MWALPRVWLESDRGALFHPWLRPRAWGVRLPHDLLGRLARRFHCQCLHASRDFAVDRAGRNSGIQHYFVAPHHLFLEKYTPYQYSADPLVFQ
jgi:hypothetical protein